MNKIFYHKGFIAACMMICAYASYAADPVTEGFDNFVSTSSMPEGWDSYGPTVQYAYAKDIETFKAKKPSIAAASPNTNNYLITPMLEGNFSFWLRNYTKNYQASVTAYACTYDGSTFVLGTQLGTTTLTKTSSGTPSWSQVTFSAASPTRVALVISTAYFDDFTYTPAEAAEGPSLVVTGFENGSTFNFGGIPVSDGTTQTFTMLNAGSQTLEISSISVSGDYIITQGDEIDALTPGQTAEVTVATPAKDAQGALTIRSNNPDGDYEINLTSTYKIPAPVMNVETEPVNFGKVSADTDRDIVIGNLGDAELTVNISSDNNEFTVAPASLSVAPGAEGSFKVNFNYNETYYGAHSATLTITPNAGETVSISVTAIVRDPATWTEDFEAGERPDGWEAGANWTFENGVAKANYVYNNNNYLITPTLIARDGDELTFKYRATYYSSDIVVEAAKDNGSYNEVASLSLSSMNDFASYTISGLEAGEYRFRFLSDRYELDDFEGLRLAVKEHDMSLSDVVIPAKGTQYIEYSASATVHELAGKDESARAVLLLNGDTVATADLSVSAGASETVTLSFTPMEAVENASVTISLEYADALVTSEVVTVSISPATALGEDEFVEFSTGYHDAVRIDYTPAEGWNIISMPFILTSDILTKIFGDDFMAFEFKNCDNGAINLYQTEQFSPGFAYAVYSENPADTSDGVILNNIRFDVTSPKYDEFSGICLLANFSSLTADELKDAYYISRNEIATVADVNLPTNPKLSSCADNEPLKGFRGYFTLPASLTATPKIVLHDLMGQTSGIVSLETTTGNTKEIYNLNGQKIEYPSKGIFIINGQKTLVR